MNTVREIKRVLETIAAGDPETEVVTEGTTPAAVAVPVVVIIVAVIAIVIIVIVRDRRRYRSTTIHDTHALHVSYSCYYCPQTGLHTTLCKYLYSVV